MTRPVDLAEVRAALARLDALLARFPHLRGAVARTRLSTWLPRGPMAQDNPKTEPSHEVH